MKVGIVGLPQAGKTSLFRLLTGLPAAQLAHGSRPQSEMLRVPDARVDWLAAHYRPKKTTYTQLEVLDFPALDPGAAKGKAELLGQVRTEADLLLAVLAAFAPPGGGSHAEPRAALATLEAEFQLADMDVLEKRLEKLDQHLRKRRTKEDADEHELLARLLAEVGDRSLRGLELRALEHERVRGFRFLSQKPLFAVVNLAEDVAGAPAPGASERLAFARARTPFAAALCVPAELDLEELPPGERAEFQAALGLIELHREALIETAYRALGLQSFYTVGADECRAWTIRRGDTALAAAGKIHQDLARGFIAAEVFRFDDLRALGDEKAVKAAGKMRLEGRDYVVGEGEIVHVRHGG